MKKLYKIAVAVVIIATAGMTAYNTQDKKIRLSSIALENVEALANEQSLLQFHLFPCISSPRNECVLSDSKRPKCPSATYCR